MQKKNKRKNIENDEQNDTFARTNQFITSSGKSSSNAAFGMHGIAWHAAKISISLHRVYVCGRRLFDCGILCLSVLCMCSKLLMLDMFNARITTIEFSIRQINAYGGGIFFFSFAISLVVVRIPICHWKLECALRGTLCSATCPLSWTYCGAPFTYIYNRTVTFIFIIISIVFFFFLSFFSSFHFSLATRFSYYIRRPRHAIETNHSSV